MEEAPISSGDPMADALAVTENLQRELEALGPAMRALGNLSLQAVDAGQLRILNARLNAVGAAVVGAQQTTESIVDALPFQSPLHVLSVYAQTHRRFTSRELFEYFEELDREHPGIMPRTDDFPALFATLREKYAEAMAAVGAPVRWRRTKALTNPKHWFEFVKDEDEGEEFAPASSAPAPAAEAEVEDQDVGLLAEAASYPEAAVSAVIDEPPADDVAADSIDLPADSEEPAEVVEQLQLDEHLLAYAEEVLREIVASESAAGFTAEHIQSALAEHCYLEPQAAAHLLQALMQRGVLAERTIDGHRRLELAPATNRPSEGEPGAELSEFLDEGFGEEELPLVEAILDYLARNLRFLKDRVPRHTLITLVQERLPVADHDVVSVLDRFAARGYIIMDRQASARAQGTFIAIRRLEPALKSSYLKHPNEVLRKMRHPVRRPQA